MAEINVPESGAKKGKLRSKKLSTRVDLTAMVDLAFLLLTFFMLTTTFNKPQAMEVNMPAHDGGPPPVIAESKTLTLLLSGTNQVHWYVGTGESPTLETTTVQGVREVIFRRQQEVAAKWGKKDELVVFIKADNQSKYGNLVAVLDEMAITNTKRYTIVDPTPADLALMDDQPTEVVENP